MRARFVVPLDEPAEGNFTLGGAAEDLDVEGLGEDGPDPALDLAVGLRPVGAGECPAADGPADSRPNAPLR